MPRGSDDIGAPTTEAALIAALAELARGRFDLLAEAEGSPLAEAIRSLATTLRDQASLQLQRTVQLSGAASEAMAATSFVTGDVRETADNANAIAAAIAQLDAAMAGISQTGTFIANTGHAVRDSAMNSLDRVSTIADTVTRLTTIEHETTERMERLVEASHGIGKMVKVIQTIARQTDMLAMNATIEAARAGEAGKGFNIVAGEVKNLAHQTAQATEDIRNHIAAIQTEVGAIRDGLSNTTAATSAGLDNITAARADISTIVHAMEELEIQMGAHATSLNEQSAATAEVARAVTIIKDKADLARENAERAVLAVAGSEAILTAQFEDLSQAEIPDSILYQGPLIETHVGDSPFSKNVIHHGKHREVFHGGPTTASGRF